ncbi:acetyl-CoA acetyltransferase [Hydrogenophaga sp. BPS33]|uniref:acetyl-CoA acetyltransferase n=1 Tax=Hydrogenophaga sp. BPS33 TaxID=2651974 RepID=UPI00131FDAA2|nr:acetyl-CoA acetyltransferase [Hydrogenophaga sp. BPS33]QHE84263.1 acetyl-CoA acetyltransferase [Hydrogenophaga sp. BPS33]
MNRADAGWQAHTPVLVGFGTSSRREQAFQDALEPMDLMQEAVAAAGADSQAPHMLEEIEHIAVPRGRWSYANPAGEIARKTGARDATTVLATVGVLQQTLVGDACARIARGEIASALVAGADAGHRLLRAQLEQQAVVNREQHDRPDIFMEPAEDLRHPVERRAGMQMPVGLYAILESAYRAKQGLGVAQHRDRIAALWSRFSHIAAKNPHAWNAHPFSPSDIREVSAHNPMQAFPYTRRHCSNWNVDQGAALLLCSASRAQALGIPRSRWIYARASAESNHMVPVSARANLADCVGAGIAGRAVLDAGGIDAGQLDLIDFYSCFPIAVQAYAEALGLPLERDLSLTGGMAFAGGPYNNYFLQATCRAAELMRAGKGRNALLSCVSGVLTKQGFGLWSVDAPTAPFVHADLTDTVAARTPIHQVLDDFSGDATVVGVTVLYGRDHPPRGIALLDTPSAERALATTEDAALISIVQERELVGERVRVRANQIAQVL